MFSLLAKSTFSSGWHSRSRVLFQDMSSLVPFLLTSVSGKSAMNTIQQLKETSKLQFRLVTVKDHPTGHQFHTQCEGYPCLYIGL